MDLDNPLNSYAQSVGKKLQLSVRWVYGDSWGLLRTVASYHNILRTHLSEFP